MTTYLAARNVAAHQTTPTYDGSNQTAEFDILYFASGWNGFNYWMALCPYDGSSSIENPSILVSNDGDTWSVPSGLTNPIVPMPSGGHNADVAAFYDPVADRIYMTYVTTPDQTNYYVDYVYSSDGITWSTPAHLTGGALTNSQTPTIIYDGSQYWFFLQWASVPTGTPGLYYSTASSVDTLPAPTTLTNIHGNFHFNIKYQSGKFYLLYSGGTTGTYWTYYAESTDGATFTPASGSAPVFGDGPAGSWDAGGTYRCAFVVTDTVGPKMDIWYVGSSV